MVFGFQSFITAKRPIPFKLLVSQVGLAGYLHQGVGVGAGYCFAIGTSLVIGRGRTHFRLCHHCKFSLLQVLK